MDNYYRISGGTRTHELLPLSSRTETTAGLPGELLTTGEGTASSTHAVIYRFTLNSGKVTSYKAERIVLLTLMRLAATLPCPLLT